MCISVCKLMICVLKLSPVEGVGLCNSPVQAAGCPVTDELKEKHCAVTCVLGNRQVHCFPRLGGDLDDWVAYSEMRGKRRNGYMLSFVKDRLVVPFTLFIKQCSGDLIFT